MKNCISRFLVLALSLATMLSTSCKDDDEQIEVRMDDMTLNFTRTALSQQIDLPKMDRLSNYWHVYSPTADQWLTHEVVPGTRTMYVYADGNTTGKVRSSYIMVRCGTQSQRIEVNQDTESRIVLSQTNLNLRYMLTSVDVEIEGIEYLKDLSASANVNWLQVSLEDNVLHITAENNSDTAPREAIVTVSGTRIISGEQTSSMITIYQGRGGLTPYVFDLPDFSQSNVYYVMDGEKQVAQIAREFLTLDGKINQQADVVYPVNEAGEVDLMKGYIARVVLQGNTTYNLQNSTYAAPTEAIHGGSISFSVADNAISSYSAGKLAEPATKIYMPGDVGMGPEFTPDSKEARVVPCLIVDKRGSEEITYPVAKISTQYWMAANLKTRYYNANKNYEAIPTGVKGSVDEPFVAVIDNLDVKAIDTDATIKQNYNNYGLLYAFSTIGGIENATKTIKANENIEDNLSPEGWIVPEWSQFQTLIDYVKWSLTLGNLDAQTSGENNITGFNSRKQKYYYPSAGFVASSSFYATYHSRTRVENGTKITSGDLILKEDNSAAARNRTNFDRAMPIRCLNNGAIKIAQ